MTRYFPELIAAAAAELPERCVIDGEIVIATDHGLDFEASNNASTQPIRACACSPSRRPLRSSRSTCSPSATMTTPSVHSMNAALPSSTR